MPSFKEVLAKRLKRARTDAGLTQAKLAAAVDSCGVSCTQSQIAGYENAASKSIPDAEKLAAIAKTLEKSADWLCGIDREEAHTQITSEQWVERMLDMVDYPGTYKTSTEDIDGNWRPATHALMHLDINPAGWPNVNELAFSLDFYGEDMNKFITAIQSVDALKEPLDYETYTKIRETVIKQYAKLFDPDILPF